MASPSHTPRARALCCREPSCTSSFCLLPGGDTPCSLHPLHPGRHGGYPAAAAEDTPAVHASMPKSGRRSFDRYLHPFGFLPCISCFRCYYLSVPVPILPRCSSACGSGAAYKRSCRGGSREWGPCRFGGNTATAYTVLAFSCAYRPGCRREIVMRTFLLAAMAAMAHGQAEGKQKEAHPICRPHHPLPGNTRLQPLRAEHPWCSVERRNWPVRQDEKERCPR